jgi:hypothetical protein
MAVPGGVIVPSPKYLPLEDPPVPGSLLPYSCAAGIFLFNRRFPLAQEYLFL